MRWSCPYCGTSLGVSDEKITGTWAFTKCYRCAEHALVRRPEVSVVKIDRPPPGEVVLLPEAAEVPMMSQEATARLRRVEAPRPPAANAIPVLNSAPTAMAPVAMALPEPLPEIRERSRRTPIRWNRLFILGGILATGGTIASGWYLYRQGQELIHRARQNLEKGARAPAQPTTTTALSPAPAEFAALTQQDEIRDRAMAPERDSIRIQVQGKGVLIYSGPGNEFPTLRGASDGERFEVADFSDQWFRISMSPSGESGWIASNRVSVLGKPTVKAEKL